MNDSRAVRRGGARLALVLLAVLTVAGAYPALPQSSPLPPPYLFILLDTSGSMNWSPPCSAADFMYGACDHLCPTGDCFVPRQGDDPSSKLHQVKQALFSATQNAGAVQLGFATFNQDSLGVTGKHWLYVATNDGVYVPGWGMFPSTGTTEVFGKLWSCDTGSGDHEIGCMASKPADLVDAWELGRVRRLPKAGQLFNQEVSFYVRQSPYTYLVRYRPLSGAPGAVAQTQIDLLRCMHSSCLTRQLMGTATVNWQPMGEFLAWDTADLTPVRTNPGLTYFPNNTSDVRVNANHTCSGWDPNDDSVADSYSGYSLRWPTDSSDLRGPLFSVGDVIPWDWMDDRRDEVLGRLSPVFLSNPLGAPDFRAAPYLEDLPAPGESFLRLKDPAARPLMASGATPLGATLSAFRTWYTDWKAIAEVQDPDWLLRRKAVVLITDGDDTCAGDPCAVAADLLNDGISTFVVAYGMTPAPGTMLECTAANGGTFGPVYPQSRADLELVLSTILEEVRAEPMP